MKPIEIYGDITDSGLMNISFHPFYEELLSNIHFVESYKSDLVWDILSFERNVKELKDGETELRWIGFRANGVDHTSYIHSTAFSSCIFGGENHTSTPKREARYYYRKLYRISVSVKENRVYALMKESDLGEFAKDLESGSLDKALKPKINLV